MENLYHPVQIGSLTVPGNLFLAPVAGYSDRSFRYVCKIHGADMCYTEMVSSEALYRHSGKTEKLLLRAPNESIFAVQLFGGNEEAMYKASMLLLEKYNPSLIDINCGCPVPKIIKSGAGSELTRNPEKAYKIISAVVKATKDFAEKNNLKNTVPVTIKIRSGWDTENLTWKEVSMAGIEAGVKAITLHSRTKKQGYEGKADWNILAQLVKTFPQIPVFGSGDVFSPEDAKRMLETTGCSGVMFARGAMGNPFIFNQTKILLTAGSYQDIPIEEKIKTGLEELEILVKDKGENAACREMRKRFCCYTKGIPNGSQIRSKIVCAQTINDYRFLSELVLSGKID